MLSSSLVHAAGPVRAGIRNVFSNRRRDLTSSGLNLPNATLASDIFVCISTYIMGIEIHKGFY